MFSEEMFLNRVILDNPWWQTGDIAQEYRSVAPRLFLDSFYQYLSMDGLRRAVLLMGPRRVGKTWLLQHAIGRLLSEKVSPQRVIFLPIDVPVYHGCDLEELVYAASRVSGVNPKTEEMFDTLLGDNLPARKEFSALHGNEYIKDADI